MQGTTKVEQAIIYRTTTQEGIGACKGVADLEQKQKHSAERAGLH